MSGLTEVDLAHLRRCVELAEQVFATGDEPFGSVLVDAEGATGDATQHAEIELAGGAARHLTPEQRAGAAVCTSGEHCPMCAAAHAWVGLGRLVQVSSSAQLAEWRTQAEAPASPVATLPVTRVAPGVVVHGPVDELVERVRRLPSRAHAGGAPG